MKKSSSEKSCIKGLTNGQNGIIINKSSEVHSVDLLSFSGDNGEKVPPVPIPNTEVKLLSAESTWLATARKDRSSPVSIFLSSSMAEHSAVNRVVVGSSPTWGARRGRHDSVAAMFFCFGRAK